MLRTDTPKAIHLKDYKPSPYQVSHIDLNFDIYDGYTNVTSVISMSNSADNKDDLFLHGEDVELLALKINGKTISTYKTDDQGLTIPCPSEKEFKLEIKTKITPESNTRLEGLYKSGDNYCTQCEAEGFRRITYYLDRPDIMATYTTRIEADKEKYPVLLSNGNKTDSGSAEGGKHFTIWQDPHPKPCYLFALVAGKFNHIHDTFTTVSGRKVDLYIYVRPGDEDQCAHAMESLKKSMKWDEDVYGLEYDLDLFNIVAVSDFNMGAMENKSLNIFNTALVLAAQETATDADFMRVESVIAHEYFHNWSGNRVTCRDWFQLSLKEGLTVFRDQEFSADLHSRPVQRIDDVTHLRRLQFAEDAGPLAHPIRPENYIEINNFYTMTVYEKGAEVIRMFRTILGAEAYRKATDLYFSRHDGDAATCDDWIKCMEDASGKDLTQFRLWYSQAGTPRVTFEGHYDPVKKIYSVELSQKIPDTPGQSGKKPMHIPVAIGLIDQNGNDLIDTKILHLTESQQAFTFENINSKPVPSVLRNFSAPVILSTNLTDDDYAFLTKHEVYDGFNRWEAGQYLHRKALEKLTGAFESGETKPDINQNYLESFADIYINALNTDITSDERALLARTMHLPDISTIVQSRENADPVAAYNARQYLLAAIKRTQKPLLQKIYKANEEKGAFSVTPDAIARRALRNEALSILTATHGTGCAKLAKEHYFAADNMTDRMAALMAIAPNANPEREEVLEDFYNRYKDFQLVIDKWFSVQASSVRPDIIAHLQNLRHHPDFNIKNPNRARSLYAAFAMNNPSSFHAQDSSGYSFLADAIIELNSINPQIAARLLTPMRDWRKYTLDRQTKMKAALERILETPNLSPDVFEITSKSLK